MTTNIFEQLKAPFPADRVSWRIGPTTADKSRGLALCYIDARDVADRLDAVCGPANWCNDYPHANGKTVCRIGLKIDGEWVHKSNGAGDTDMEAEKGALSDAFKRAATMWGVGRYLYDIPSQWVDIEAAGRSFKIKPSELDRLARFLQGQQPLRGLEKATADLAATLIAELRTHTTIANLEAWRHSDVIRKRFAALDDAGKARLTSAYNSHVRKMTEEQNIAA